ncbi:MAG: V-type ATP synthase subunit I [Acutalibacteraceae bacterium]|nr:V-type ATP synthase subunit I [Acutalibacteraceae bacterium]
MAILNMKRIEILGLQKDRKKIIEFVQRQGCVQLDEMQEEGQHFTNLPTQQTVTQLERYESTVDSALEVLNRYTSGKGGLLDSFAPREEMSTTEYLEKSKNVDATLGKCKQLNALYKKIQDSKVEIVRAETAIDQVRPWETLDIPSSFKGTADTQAFIGTIAEPLDREGVLTKIVEADPEAQGEVEIVSADKNQTCLVAICHKDNAKTFEQALRTAGFVAVSDATKHPPKVRIERLTKQIEQCNADIAEAEEAIKTYDDSRDDIAFLKDYLTLRTDKYKVLDKVSVDDSVFVISGYIPETKAEGLKNKLESKFDTAVNLSDVDNESDEVPVAVHNNKLGMTMESITNMYAFPSHKDIDPSFIMTTFYYLLFGLMLGDAGYGLVMTFLCLFVKFKYKLEPRKRATVNYGLGCGLSTTFWGAMQNSWFGDLPKWIANGLKSNEPTDFISTHHLYWFDPLQNTTRFLLLCFFIGILHLILANCINLYKMSKQGMAFEGFFEVVPILLILVGIIPVINSYIGGGALAEIPSTQPIDNMINAAAPVLYILLIIGAIGVVVGPAIVRIKQKSSVGKVLGGLGGGLYGLYNAASGYLGDILSYARLLALGLCTGVIASVINQLAATPGGGNWFLFIIIFIIGHTINLGINLIGAYVHTNRLQYVEFFSKFYEGGGKPFTPLSAQSQSFVFKEEN